MSPGTNPLDRSGIYNIININNLKHYIGSAVMIRRRLASHLQLLRKGKHPNRYLQASWKKYGEGSFEFVVVEHVDDEAELTNVEQLYIDAYWTSGCLFNLSPTASSQLGVKFSPDGKKHCSTSAKRRANSHEGKEHIRLATIAAHTPEAIAKSKAVNHAILYDTQEGVARRKLNSEQKTAQANTKNGKEQLARALKASKTPESMKKQADSKRSFTPGEAQEIRNRLAAGEKQNALAKELGCGQMTISNILHHKFGY